MRIDAVKLGLAAGGITAIAFGFCGVLFAVAPTVTSQFVSWVLHIDVTGMTRPISAYNLAAGITLFSTYVGVLVGLVAAVYNLLLAEGRSRAPAA